MGVFRVVLDTDESMLAGIPLMAFITAPAIFWIGYTNAFGLVLGAYRNQLDYLRCGLDCTVQKQATRA